MIKLFTFLDAGHGGIVDGRYTTAPKKMFKHKDGSVAYEGVINRNIVKEIKLALYARGMDYVDVVRSEHDTPLSTRVILANNEFERKAKNTAYLYFSVHNNAGGGHGLEIFTSLGQTNSDKYATLMTEVFAAGLPEARMRTDFTDNDPDKEDRLYVLDETRMPALLCEYGFFDNFDDWKLLNDPQYIKRIADLTADGFVEIEKSLNI